MIVTMNQERILYEDKDIIVCHKAAGIATQTARVGQADMVSEIMNYLANTTHGSTKEKYVGVVHRLDQPVEGILVFAKNRQAASELGRQVTENRMEKYYYAVVCGRSFAQTGTLTDYLLKDGRTNMSRIVPSEVKGAKKAVLDYEVVPGSIFSSKKFMAANAIEQPVLKEAASQEDESQSQVALARIRLHTGRHHQIRIQMSRAGMSLLGDYKYADEEAVEISEQMHVKEIALCAYRLALRHPGTGKQMQFQISPEGKCFRVAKSLMKELNW